MGQVQADFLYALRGLRKSPGFTIIAVLTLALGIGANTAIFTVVNAVLLKPLPYSDPSSLVLVGAARGDRRAGGGDVYSINRFEFIRDNSRSFSGIAAFSREDFNISGSGEPEQISSARVSWNFLEVLGVRPALGRTFRKEEDQPGAAGVVLLSHEFWQRRFGANPSIVGQSISLDSQDYMVIGIMPAGFQFGFVGTDIGIWATQEFLLNITTPQHLRSGAGYLNAVARLVPGVSQNKAQAEMDVLNLQFQHQFPGRPDADPRLSITVDGLQEQLVANVRTGLWILLGAVGFILLIACSNVASLLLSRALGRKKEIAIRTALGAKRSTIARQLLIESLALACAAGIAGILLGFWGVRGLTILTKTSLPIAAGAHIDLGVLAFSAAVSIASGLLFGLVPALQLSRPDLNSVLREEGRGSTGSRERGNTRNLLVMAEVALSMVLLVGSGLLIRSFIQLQTAALGFDPNNVVTMAMSLPPARYAKPDQMIDFYNRALQSVAALPGIQAATISSALPVNPSRLTPALLEGQPVVPVTRRPIMNIQTISPDYLKVLRVPLVRGREFNNHDDAAAPRVIIVNQALVRRFWPNDNPIGKHIWLGQLKTPAEVVGVVGDMKNSSLAIDPQPEMMLPFPQLPWARLNLSVRTAGDPRGVIPAVRRQIATLDKDLPLVNVLTMEELMATARAQPRTTMLLLGLFAATALILALVGIYGVISYSVAQRMQELGIRLALGAARGDIFRMMIALGLRLTAAGIAVGLAGSYFLTRLMSTLLYKVQATDPLTYIGGAALFLIVALVASFVPARRATKLDPIQALQQ